MESQEQAYTMLWLNQEKTTPIVKKGNTQVNQINDHVRANNSHDQATLRCDKL